MHHSLHQSVAAAAAASTAERDGLWLIGVGAFFVAASLLSQGSAGGLSGRPGGLGGTRSDRIAFSVGLTGALLVAIGSLDVAVEAFPDLLVVAATVGISALIIWLFAAFRLRADCRKNRDDARRGAESDSPLAPGRRWDAERYQRQMEWRRCLTNPFVGDEAAHRRAAEALGERPVPYEGGAD